MRHSRAGALLLLCLVALCACNGDQPEHRPAYLDPTPEEAKELLERGCRPVELRPGAGGTVTVYICSDTRASLIR